MDKKKIATQLRAAAHKLQDVTVKSPTSASKLTDAMSLASDLSALTQENDHTEARLQLAEALNNRKWMSVLTSLQTIQSAYGYMPPGGAQIQSDALDALLAQAEKQWGPAAAQVLYAAF